MKKLLLAVTLIFMMISISCCKKETEESSSPSYSAAMEFEKEQYDLTSGSVNDVKVTGCEQASFTVINEKIAAIVSSKNKECRVEGKKEGATVIKAVSGNNECRSILNVTDSVSSRSVKNDEWYICSFAYFIGDQTQTVETFFTKGRPVIETDQEFIFIKKENGKYACCKKEKFMYIEYESYRG